MLHDIETLAEKTDAVIATLNQLREENTRLRSDLASLSSNHRELQQRLNLAIGKVESLLEQLPQEP
jgi:FtsZ-binding cell division protein ZapB